MKGTKRSEGNSFRFHPGADIGRRENPELNKLRNYDRNYLSIYTVRECAQTMFVQLGEPNNE